MPSVQCLQCDQMVDMDLMDDHIKETHPKRTSDLDTLDHYWQPERRSEIDVSPVIDDTIEEIFPALAPVARDHDQDDSVTQLQDMFPTRSVCELEVALSSSATIESAVEGLLADDTGSVTSNQDSNDVGDGNFELEDHFEKKLQGLPQALCVDRGNFWQAAFGFYKRACDFGRPLRVAFNGEEGIDAGGPRREFFQCLANHIGSVEAGLFEGSKDSLLPTMKGSTLRLGLMKTVGKMFAHSIANGGIGFPFLAEAIFEFMVTENAEDCLPLCSIAMVPEHEARDTIQEIATSPTKAEFEALINRPEIIDYTQKCGWTSLLSFDNKENLVATMLLHEVIWRRQTAINQLMDGLKVADVLVVVKRHPEHLKSKFVRSELKITKELLVKEMFFKETVSKAEESSKSFFLSYLEDEKDLTLGEEKRLTRREAILAFTTGEEVLGPAGLKDKMTVEYSIMDGDDFPAASTCSNILVLPVKHDCYEKFSEMMDKALEMGLYGFGEA